MSANHCSTAIRIGAVFAIWGACVSSVGAQTSASALAKTAAEADATGTGLERAWYNQHAIHLATDQNLPGTVSIFSKTGELVPATNRRVVLMQNGLEVAVGRTDEYGNFQLPAAPGIYTVKVGDFGDRAGLAFAAIHVMPPDQTKYDTPRPRFPFPGRPTAATKVVETAAPNDVPAAPATPAPATAAPAIPGPTSPGPAVQAPALPAPTAKGPKYPTRLEIAMIGPEAVKRLKAVINEEMFGRSAGTPRTAARQSLQPATRTLATLLTDRNRTTVTPAAEHRSVSSGSSFRELLAKVPYDGPWHLHHQLFLDPDRSLHGKVRTFTQQGELIPASSARLIYIRSDGFERQTVADPEGRFRIPPMQPGVYSVLVAHRGGFGCYAVRLVDNFLGEPVQDAESPIRSAQFRRDGLQVHEVSLKEQQENDGSSSTVGTNEDSSGAANNGNFDSIGTGTGFAGGTTPSGGGAAGGGSSIPPGAAAAAGLAAGAGLGYFLASPSN